ncbi:hypothetical protein KY284_029781 [Solanum tuberosum]|nr:hypothetical protein KY284_029781 [Solanum tuberosum]
MAFTGILSKYVSGLDWLLVISNPPERGKEDAGAAVSVQLLPFHRAVGRSCCPAEAALERQSSGAAACSSLPAREEKAEGFCRCSTPCGGLAGKGEEREKASSPLLAFAGKMARRERGGGSDLQGKRGGESKCFKVLVD